jgi:dihydrofolate synthase / folylpolyglutamate synthase
MPSAGAWAAPDRLMNYAAATRYVEGLAILGMRFGLERMVRLLAALGDPQRSAPAIHVVGTNGKSSTARLAAACLQSQGLRVGTYLSPHIVGWRERIEIDQRAVDETAFAEAITSVRAAGDALDLADDDGVTQFEVLTAAAFAAFATAGVDAMVIEAGLGGRWDATNVLPPDTVDVLTNVALEHTELLGSTEAEIAAEKLAVVPDGSDRLIVGRLSLRAQKAVEDECRTRGLHPQRVGHEVGVAAGPDGVDVITSRTAYSALPLPLHGTFQRDNLAAAVAAAELRLGAPLRVDALREAIAAVRMPGRLEVIPGQPLMVLDGAHNPAGVEAMASSLQDVVEGRPTIAVVSILGDKDATAMVSALTGVCAGVIATRSHHPRAAAPDVIAHLARLAGLPAQVVEDPLTAIDRARDMAGPSGAVLVCGSLYLLADVREQVMNETQSDGDMLAGEIEHD